MLISVSVLGCKLTVEKEVVEMKIRNINGTSQNTCVCGSWLKHWENFSKRRISLCPVIGCYNTSLVGAHVQKAYVLDYKWYIVPLCNAHNQSKYELEVDDSIDLVPADKRETCEKMG